MSYHFGLCQVNYFWTEQEGEVYLGEGMLGGELEVCCEALI